MARDAYFDNARLFFIILVVFGHMIQPFTSDMESVGTLYTWIYTFHMPAFIFLAGFFAKGSGNIPYIFKLAKKLIIPYIIFQLIYTLYYLYIGKNNWLTDNIFYPHWSLWFLFSLFCWHIMLIIYKKIPAIWSITIAICIGIIVGYFDQIGHEFSLSRTIVFFPYFLIGYYVTKPQLKLVKKKQVKVFGVLTMLLLAFVVSQMPEIETGWLLASKSYAMLGEELYGGIVRLTVYLVAILMTIGVLAWIPERRFSFTVLGERTLYVYLLHGFFIQYFRQADLFVVTELVDIIGLAVLSILIVLLLSSKYMMTIWEPVIEISTKRIQRFWRNVLQRYD